MIRTAGIVLMLGLSCPPVGCISVAVATTTSDVFTLSMPSSVHVQINGPVAVRHQAVSGRGALPQEVHTRSLPPAGSRSQTASSVSWVPNPFHQCMGIQKIWAANQSCEFDQKGRGAADLRSSSWFSINSAIPAALASASVLGVELWTLGFKVCELGFRV